MRLSRRARAHDATAPRPSATANHAAYEGSSRHSAPRPSSRGCRPRPRRPVPVQPVQRRLAVGGPAGAAVVGPDVGPAVGDHDRLLDRLADQRRVRVRVAHPVQVDHDDVRRAGLLLDVRRDVLDRRAQRGAACLQAAAGSAARRRWSRRSMPARCSYCAVELGPLLRGRTGTKPTSTVVVRMTSWATKIWLESRRIRVPHRGLIVTGRASGRDKPRVRAQNAQNRELRGKGAMPAKQRRNPGRATYGLLSANTVRSAPHRSDVTRNGMA